MSLAPVRAVESSPSYTLVQLHARGGRMCNDKYLFATFALLKNNRMKDTSMYKRASLLLCCLLPSAVCSAGSPIKVRFVYDQAGNRIQRMLRLDDPKKQELRSMVRDSLGQSDSLLLPQANQHMQALTDVRLYPNPTDGYLTLTVQEWKAGSVGTVAVYDLQGRPLLVRSLTEARMDLDLTAQSSGIYLLRVQIGAIYSTWKIHKR